ncbi:hypothetical protein KL86PLE_20045 [uncultured Pleomorphomonas sp.]|uniref:Uncharacterized protein n=1 Tax=uncultured Pleomorphomonas sp. TaxID=442121 RepID=A0A212LD16_9HYPH|nr:hypothetical protein KL86PLE_20045 [uncultured Pleomorphomonas sp.]
MEQSADMALQRRKAPDTSLSPSRPEVLACARMTIYGSDALGDDGVMGTFAYPGKFPGKLER